MLVIAALTNPGASIAAVEPVEAYATGTSSFFSSFIEGYGTMDAIAGLAFGIVVVDVIRRMGVDNDDAVAVDVLGSGALDGSINAVLLSPEYPDRPDVLVLCDDCLWLSRDDGATWKPLEGEGISAVAAPSGLGAGAFLLAGTMGGGVARIPVAG